jgi:hypothetical protein
MNQQSSSNNMNTAIKETWLNSITLIIRNNAKGGKKGWFNIDESNLEVYTYSKLRKFMNRVNLNYKISIIARRKYKEKGDKNSPKQITIIFNPIHPVNHDSNQWLLRE